MHRPLLAAAVTLAAVTMAIVAPPSSAQQGQLPLPPGGFKPPPMPPIKPYKAVAVTPRAPLNDPSFAAFRKQLGDIAAHKDRDGLAKLIVAQGFFWIQDKNIADPNKPAIDNLAKAIDLEAADGSGWDTVAGYATEPTAAEPQTQKGIVCAPANPVIDLNELRTLSEATQTDASEWGYPTQDGAEVRAAAQPNAPVIEKLGMILVHVLPDTAPPANANDPVFLHVALPSGKTGFIDVQSLAPLGGDQMCYAKDASSWKIAGYVGGAAQQ